MKITHKSSSVLADQLFPVKAENNQLEILDISPEQRRLHTETYDFTVATIYDNLKSGAIFIPQFQRSYVWNRSQASRLIESLVIQCPIPVIYLNQEQDERLSVIDGNQRLQSIKLFLNDGYALRGLTTYPELEGYVFSELDPRIRRHILNRTLRCIAILKETHPQIKFDVFERLNTGAVQLNPQELRHGIYHGDLMKRLEKFSQNTTWRDLSGITSDTRMKGAELILRFLAMYEDLKTYQKPLSEFLNGFCHRNQNPSSEQLNKWSALFPDTVRRTQQLLGKLAFRSLDEQGKPNKNINAALFDAQMVAIAHHTGELHRPEPQLLKKKLMALYEETEFKESITAGTSATSLVKFRISRFASFIKELES